MVAGPIERWIAFLDGEIALAAATMTVELGDESMCTVHKDGRVTGGLKYQEGRLHALAEARRLAGSDDLDSALQGLVARWQTELDRRRGSESPSLPWVAYATGGVEAVEKAVGSLRFPG